MTTGPGPRAVPREVVGGYTSYSETERAVDFLSDRGFPVGRAAIVGRDLDFVEQITGRYTYLSAAGQGAATGVVIGALFGWLFGLVGWVTPVIAGLLLALYGAVFGAAVGAVLGALIGVLRHAGTGGRRDFSSRPTFQANTYEVLVETEVADRARQLLSAQDAPGSGSVSSGF